MIALRSLRPLGASCSGSTAIEFALLAPAFIGMLLGVLQIGIGLQNYNALRGLSADVARYAMIEQARGDPQSNDALHDYTIQAGSGAPYLLNSAALDVTVADAATPQYVGVKELTLTVTYQIPTLFSMMGLNGPHISYSRPIFLTADS
jgi:Flp pilus assembly protein TadG